MMQDIRRTPAKKNRKKAKSAEPKGKRYRCAVCKRKSPRKIKGVPYYCPNCKRDLAEMKDAGYIRVSDRMPSDNVPVTAIVKRPSNWSEVLLVRDNRWYYADNPAIECATLPTHWKMGV